MLNISEKNNPSHDLILALKKYGINNAELIFAPRWSNDFGWTVVNSDGWIGWIGFSKSHAIENILPRLEQSGEFNQLFP